MGEMKKMVLIVAGLAGFGTWEARPENKIDFARDIQPILQKSCVECHGPEKPKAKLRLDSKEAAVKGGKDGVVIVPGKADESEMYRRIRLPAGNDDVMPNKGDLLSKVQTDLIQSRIKSVCTLVSRSPLFGITSSLPAGSLMRRYISLSSALPGTMTTPSLPPLTAASFESRRSLAFGFSGP